MSKLLSLCRVISGEFCEARIEACFDYVCSDVRGLAGSPYHVTDSGTGSRQIRNKMGSKTQLISPSHCVVELDYVRVT